MFALLSLSLSRISQALSHVAEAGLGTAMLYELIEVRSVLEKVLPFQREQFLSGEAMGLDSTTSGDFFVMLDGGFEGLKEI